MRASASSACSRYRVHRPPVLMVHGLWSDAGAFADMDQTLASSNYEPYQLYRLDYRNTNDSHFDVNYPQVSGGLDAVIQQSADAALAAGKADVVTHSMGGVISRLYVQSPDYQHEVRRIVTSNTPHAGSQMANLLLDRTFDPQGLLCSMLSQAMSSPSVPNRGCFNGAVEDMQVASPATVIDLNQGTQPTDIGVHAIATFFDLAGATDLSSIPVTKETVGPLIVAQVLRGCGLSLIDTIFGFDDSDLIVSVTSQAGGLGGTLRSLFPDQIHMGATANSGVIQEVRNLLNEPKDSSKLHGCRLLPPAARIQFAVPVSAPAAGPGAERDPQRRGERRHDRQPRSRHHPFAWRIVHRAGVRRPGDRHDHGGAEPARRRRRDPRAVGVERALRPPGPGGRGRSTEPARRGAGCRGPSGRRQSHHEHRRPRAGSAGRRRGVSARRVPPPLRHGVVADHRPVRGRRGA